MKRAKGYLNLHCRKFLFNALMKPIFEYCCSVWGNAPNDQLLRLLRVQKRCGRLILDARLLENCAQKFQKLKWLPIDGIIRIKKLCMMFKIVNKECPDYFTSYRSYIQNTKSYNTRLSSNNALAVPKCRSNAGLRTFHARSSRLWNRLDDKLKNMTNESNFKKHLLERFLNINASRKHLLSQSHFKVPFLFFNLDCTELKK